MAKKKSSFEKNIKELENIIKEMEDLHDDLDSAIELYKKGSKLALICNDDLQKYENEIFILKEDMDKKIQIDVLEGK